MLANWWAVVPQAQQAEAVQAVVHLMGDTDGEVRQAGARAAPYLRDSLTAQSAPRVVDALCANVDHADEKVRAASLMALAKVAEKVPEGARAAVAARVKAAFDRGDVAQKFFAAAAAASYADQLAPNDKGAMIAYAIGKLSEEGAEPLRAVALKVVGEMGPLMVEGTGPAVYRLVESSMRSKDEEVREAALRAAGALAKDWAPQLRSQLAERLRSAASEATQEARGPAMAALALAGRYLTPPEVESLAAFWREMATRAEESATVRGRAAFAMGMLAPFASPGRRSEIAAQLTEMMESQVAEERYFATAGLVGAWEGLRPEDRARAAEAYLALPEEQPGNIATRMAEFAWTALSTKDSGREGELRGRLERYAKRPGPVGRNASVFMWRLERGIAPKAADREAMLAAE
jgi:hypothetical protein